MMNAIEIREKYLQFFESKLHKIVPSDSIVIKNDPTLLFTNAGMNQFKDYFLGIRKAAVSRVVDTQKCLRVSGKHNDLEEVGVDTYHHTMFEMLGNWSFGDYFKEEAIAWSWELLTEVYGIDKDRIYVSVFEGDAKEQLEADTESLAYWKLWINEDRILYGNKKDNFWEMGDSGPCGPCTEIHVDMRSDDERATVDGKTLVNNDHPQVIEIWNNVFMQYNRKADGTLEPLPDKHVDTGMGFERLVRVLQGKQSNYDTDVFQPLLIKVAQKVGMTYGTDEKIDIAMRVLSDHIRAISFCIADGQLPSNTGAGYVVRRILRRAVRYYYSILNYEKPLLTQLVATLAEQFKSVFPSLYEQKELVAKVILEEENSFLMTLEKGLKKMENYAVGSSMTGAAAFELYDTFGFPFDLTRLIAKEKNIEVDEPGFQSAMFAQKTRSRKAAEVETGDWVDVIDTEEATFVGYSQQQSSTRLVRYRKINAKGKDAYQLVLEQTPFYAESGGQVGDTGIISMGGELLKVWDTKKENNQTIHYVDNLPENIDGTALASIDSNRRTAIENNHSVTHLLQAALREVLGEHVHQKGSYVGSEYLRFDFGHYSKIDEVQLKEIEEVVNSRIRLNTAVEIKTKIPIANAIAMGATALFGEKYGEEVRVVSIDSNYSIELCGGTHVAAVGQIGLFKIISESSVAAGIRRIEAITAQRAEAYVNEQCTVLSSAKNLLKTKDILKTLEVLLLEQANLKKQIELLMFEKVALVKSVLLTKKSVANSVVIITETIDITSIEAIKTLCFQLKNENVNTAIIIGAVVENKPMIFIALSDDLIKNKNLNAGLLVKQVSHNILGGGGGQAFYASAAGTSIAGLQAALDEAINIILT